MIDTEILQDYSSEARELLDEMDNSLMRLEKEGESPDLLNTIFRAVHCIKGSAEYIGLERSGTLTHGVENLLDRLREGAIPLTPEVMDFLFRAKDLITRLINEVERDHEEKTEISEIMTELDLHLSQRPGAGPVRGDQPVSEEKPSVAEEPETFPEELREASLEGVTEEAFTGYPETEEYPEEVAGREKRREEEVGEDSFEMFPEDLGMDLRGEEAEEAESLFEPDALGEDVAPDEEDALSETHDARIEEARMGSAPESALFEKIEEPAPTLDETVTNVLNVSLYLDDLQDGVSPGQAYAAILSNVRTVKQSMQAEDSEDALAILDLMETRLGLIASDPSRVTSDEVEALRSLLHDLRPYYPKNLFPLEERPAKDEASPIEEEAEEMVSGPSPLREKLEQIPGLERAAVEAILAQGFTDLEDVAGMDVGSLSGISGVTVAAAEAVLKAAGVLPQVQRPQPARQVEERSLLADVDDELLQEFEGIFGSEPQAEPASSQNRPLRKAGRAGDLVEELGVIGEDADREIMEIFLSYGWEIMDKLGPVVAGIGKGKAERADMDRCADLIKSIRSSSTYMDYQSLAAFLDEWYEKTLWASERLESLAPEQLSFMEENRLRFQDFLIALDQALNPKAAPVAPVQPPISDRASVEPKPQEQPPLRPVPEQRRPTEAAVQASSPPVPPPAQAARARVEETALREAPTEELVREEPQSAPTGDYERRMMSEPGLSESASPEEAGAPSDSEGVSPQQDLTQEGALVKTMRVDSAKVDLLLNQVGELVVNRSYVEQLFSELKNLQKTMVAGREIGKREVGAIKDITLKVAEASLSLGRVATDIQEGVMKLRMLPVGQLFNRMPRLIRDLSRRVGKAVGLEVYGGDTEVDKRVIEQIYNPLVHLIRNAVDHGIEDAETRAKLGKNVEGAISLRAYSEGNQVVIDVEDDGGGINSEAVIRRAVQNRLLEAQEAPNISNQDLYNFLFLPGFSTSKKVTRTSGRGVGMDVVKKDVEKINGHIEIESWESKGTRISIKIPLTLAIIQTLLIRIGKYVFALPLTAVREIIQISPHEITTIEGFEVIKFREETIPVLRINELFHLKEYDASSHPKYLVLATAGLKSVGLLTEDLLGEQDVVIKPLAEHVCEIRGLAGSTILGDGRIALVLDVSEMIDDVVAHQRMISQSGFLYPRNDEAHEGNQTVTF